MLYFLLLFVNCSISFLSISNIHRRKKMKYRSTFLVLRFSSRPWVVGRNEDGLKIAMSVSDSQKQSECLSGANRWRAATLHVLCWAAVLHVLCNCVLTASGWDELIALCCVFPVFSICSPSKWVSKLLMVSSGSSWIPPLLSIPRATALVCYVTGEALSWSPFFQRSSPPIYFPLGSWSPLCWSKFFSWFVKSLHDFVP